LRFKIQGGAWSVEYVFQNYRDEKMMGKVEIVEVK